MGRRFTVKDRYLGPTNTVEYEQCEACESVQIREIPSSLSHYYPTEYYSMVSPGPARGLSARLKSFANRQLDRQELGKPNLLGLLVSAMKSSLPEIRGAGLARPSISARILDVGCGTQAQFLRRLAAAGFTDLTGIDPFIETDVIRFSGVTVLKRSIDELSGQFDLITFNHSLEHMPDPRGVFSHLRRLLSRGGKCIIRIPTPSSEAFERYSADWVQLDAPRHLNLPSRRGMAILAASQKMTVVETVDDSTAFQFIGSEFNRRDIAPDWSKVSEILSRHEIAKMKKRARWLNKIGRGDQTIYLVAPGNRIS